MLFVALHFVATRSAFVFFLSWFLLREVVSDELALRWG